MDTLPNLSQSNESPLWRSIREMAADLKARIAGQEAERVFVAGEIGRIQDQITSVTAALSQSKSALAAIESEIASLRLQQDFAGTDLANNVVGGYLGSVVPTRPDYKYARADLAVVSQPSLPDKKFYPLRLLSAVLAAFIGCFLACFILAFVHLVERLPRVAR